MRHAAFLVSLLLLAPTVAGASFETRKTCQNDEEPLLSLYSKTGGNVAEPGYYKWNVCGEGVRNAELKTSCGEDETDILSILKKNNSHASTYDAYSWKVCSPDLTASITTGPCDDPIVSMAKKHDSHVAEPGHFQYELCPTDVEQPDNITLEFRLDADRVFVDDQEVGGSDYSASLFEYPYIVSGQPAGIVSYAPALGIEYRNRSRDVFRVTQKQAQGHFILPFTGGGYQTVEEEEDSILERGFLDILTPSFAYFKPKNPVIRVIYQFQHPIVEFRGTEQGIDSIAVQNKINKQNNTELIIKAD